MRENECVAWLKDARKVFPKLKRKKISADYEKMSGKSLGYIKTKNL